MVRMAMIGLWLGLCLAPRAVAQTTGPAGDRDAVTRAALDYLEGFYEGDSTKFLRSVRPDFYKIGFWRPQDSTNYAAPERMTWAEALAFIRRVKERKNFAPATAPKEVAILDVMGQTAAAKVTAWWGTDYLLMGRFEGRWMITQVLWQSPPARSAPLEALHHLVRARVAADSFSGAVILAHCDSILLEIYAGPADRDRSRSVGPETRFRIASMTKMLTGIAVMQLIQAGKLAPSDTIAHLVPALPPDPFNRITVDQLLTHTSGLGSIWKPEFFSRGAAAFRTTADYLPLFVGDTLLFAPGARWAYSNAGYVLLGLAIEQVSGETYPAYVRRHLYSPAGMSPGPADEIGRADPDRALAYTRGGEGRPAWRSAESIGLQRMMPAGGAVLSARDLHRFGLALFRYRLLDSATTVLTTTGRVEYRPGARYGYGFANEVVGGHRIVFHDGGADGISTNLDLVPERGLIAIVLANLDPPAARPIRDALRAEMLSPHRSNAGSCQ